jgi:hypothetical protein
MPPAALGITFNDTLPGLPYVLPRTTRVGYLFSNRIRFYTPPNHNYDSTDLALDTLWQGFVAGHEIGHMVNFGHDTLNDNSIMNTLFQSTTPPNEYFQVDLDSFLVKPRLQ